VTLGATRRPVTGELAAPGGMPRHDLNRLDGSSKPVIWVRFPAGSPVNSSGVVRAVVCITIPSEGQKKRSQATVVYAPRSDSASINLFQITGFKIIDVLQHSACLLKTLAFRSDRSR